MRKTSKTPAPPGHMGKAGRRLWRRIMADYDVPESVLDLLEQCCGALDRAESCRERIDAEGLVVLDRFEQTRPHALLAAERDARSQFRMLYRELGLEEPDEKKTLGRPPGTGRLT